MQGSRWLRWVLVDAGSDGPPGAGGFEPPTTGPTIASPHADGRKAELSRRILNANPRRGQWTLGTKTSSAGGYGWCQGLVSVLAAERRSCAGTLAGGWILPTAATMRVKRREGRGIAPQSQWAGIVSDDAWTCAAAAPECRIPRGCSPDPARGPGTVRSCSSRSPSSDTGLAAGTSGSSRSDCAVARPRTRRASASCNLPGAAGST